MSSRIDRLKILSLCWLVIALAFSSEAQTFKVDGSFEKPQNDQARSGSTRSPSSQSQLGWGSNIQNARLARAVEQALKEGQNAAAVEYAQRAVQAAPNDPQLWFLLGYAARIAGKSQLSLDAYNHGLRLDPGSLEGQSGLAQTYAATGRYEDAERILKQVLAKNQHRAGDLSLLGEIYMRSGQYDKALGTLAQAERIQPAARSELLLALAYQHSGQLDRAKQYLEMAKRRAPDNPDVQRSLAGFYRETGNYAAAIAALKSIATKPDVKAELAYTYQLYGKSDEASKLYVEAADGAPANKDLQLSAAQAEVNAGSLEGAERFLKRATDLDPDHYRLHVVRADIDRIQDNDEAALKEYAFALDHLPGAVPEGPLYRIQLRMRLVELYQRLQNEDAAHRELQTAQTEIQALEMNGGHRTEFLRLRALIKSNSGDLDGAAADIKAALAVDAKDPGSLQLDGDVLTRLGRLQEAAGAYRKILAMDPNNRYALTSMGYLSREMGHDQDAEKYFRRLASAHPKLYVPYLALGDMYTARREFPRAQASYQKGYELATRNPLLVAGGMNAAIEAHAFSLAARWLDRANDDMKREPHLMREMERYLTWVGKYEESAGIGREAIKKLPKDRDVVVYLGYDLLHMERYDELLELTSRYEKILPKEPALPLLAGYVHKHSGDYAEAEADFTRVLNRDPKVVTGYVNRGYVRHDLHKAQAAASDFESALRLEPKNGEAHLGLAFASLDLHRPRMALRHVQLAQAQLGESMSIHLVRATAYGEEGMLTQAAVEYRAALKYSPQNSTLHLALADTLDGLHEYLEAITEFQVVEKMVPDKSLVWARLSRCYAHMHDREKTLQYVHLAEQHGESSVYLSTGEALTFIGEHEAAMQRFEKAITAPDNNRMSVRLAIAGLMVDDGDWDGARRQIALGLMESQAGEALPPTADQLFQAANFFLTMHDFALAESYFNRALAAGASETTVGIGLANTYLAQGDTVRAEAEMSSVKVEDGEPSRAYLLTQASLFRQKHQDALALNSLAQAASVAGQEEAADRELLSAAANEGWRINRRLSVLTDFSLSPIFEDTTVYPLDFKLGTNNSIPGRQGLLPLPRSSLETRLTSAFHLHLDGLPTVGGFFQVRNARGEISLPSTNTIVDRNTTDYSFNFGLSPTLRLGRNALTFNAGLQETFRRDADDPIDMDQNLFRQFVYMSTSSFFNMVAVDGSVIRETGPFIKNVFHLHSRDLSAELNFRVGRPWAKTALLTGYGARDLQFSPFIREFYSTSVYLGVDRHFSEKFDLKVIAQHQRAWRVENNQFAIAQALRPAASVQFAPARNWSVEGTVAYSRNMGFHAFDAVQSGFSLSYAKSVRRSLKEGNDEIPLRYPIRFTVGLQQESFFNFNQGKNQQFRPYVSITIF